MTQLKHLPGGSFFGIIYIHFLFFVFRAVLPSFTLRFVDCGLINTRFQMLWWFLFISIICMQCIDFIMLRYYPGCPGTNYGKMRTAAATNTIIYIYENTVLLGCPFIIHDWPELATSGLLEFRPPGRVYFTIVTDSSIFRPHVGDTCREFTHI